VTADRDASHASMANNGGARPLSRSARRGSRGSILVSGAGVAAVLVGALSALWTVLPAGAVDNTGQFEMDGNIAQQAATAPPYDWGTLFNSSGVQTVTPDPVNGPLLASQFVVDTATPDSSYFASNKDIETVSQWGCGPINNPSNKDDIQNAYAAIYQIPAGAPESAGHKVLYMASERDTNNGTSFAGFWLFKDKTVGCDPAVGTFTGSHTVGDLLVVSDYTNGGGTQDVSVYKWVGGASPLSLVLTGGVCPTPPTGIPSDDACAIANPATITSTWAPTSHASNTFVEAALDLNNLFTLAGGSSCFSTFLAETRSSDQLTATLKDFAGGQLNTCLAPPIATTATPGGATQLPGATQHDEATITGSPNKPAPSGTITFTLCGPAAVTAAGCPSGSGTQVGSPVTIVTGAAKSSDVTGITTPSDLTPGKYCWRADYTPDTAGANNYLPSTHTNASTECFTVVKASPNIATQIAVTGNGGLVNTSYGDTATLTNFVGTVTTETVTFTLFGPYASNVTPTCAVGSGQPVFTTTGALNAGGVATASATFTPTAAGKYVWVASYPGDTLNDSVAEACNGANENGTIAPPVIAVAKSADALSVSAGTGIGFTVTVSNTGSGTATGVNLSDALPGGNAAAPVHWVIDSTTLDHASFSISGPDGGQQLVFTGQPISLGGTSSLAVHVTAATSSTSCAKYDNTASATSGNDGSDQHSASTTVLCPSIHVAKTADALSVSAGTGIGFTVTVSNTGLGNATGVNLTDALPGGNAATPVHWVIDSGTGNPSSFAISGPDGSQQLKLASQPVGMSANSSLTVHVTAATTKTSCTTYDNTASASATNDGSDQQSASETVLCASIQVAKTADALSVSAGTGIGFTVTVTNTGGGTATGVNLSDALPGGNAATPVHWVIDPTTGNPSSFSVSGPDGTQQLILAGQPVSMNAAASLAVHVTATTSSTSCATYDNTASATTTNDGSDQHSASETVLCPSIHVAKTADALSVSAGTGIGFTVTVSNTGLGNATGVNLTDALPGGNAATPVHWVIDSGTGNPSSFSISGPDSSQQLVLAGQPVSLAANSSLTVHVTATTTKTSCTTYDNTASASATNDGSDQHSASETVLCPNIGVAKTADSATVSAGQVIGYTVTVNNAGPGTATGVTLTDAMPGGNAATPVHWVIDPATGNPSSFSISGPDGSQQLTLAGQPITVGSGGSLTVHVLASTTLTSCATYDNSATAAATNGNTSNVGPVAITVQCPNLAILKTATPVGPVSTGTPIGFTITVSNSNAAGTGTALGVTLADPLPAGSGINWVISPAYLGPGTCGITGAVGSQVLNCALGDMLKGASITVGIVSPTTLASAGHYTNTGTAQASNNPPVSSTAPVTVLAPGLNILKSADSASVIAGNSIGFTVTATNAGPGVATGVTISDPLPGASGVSWSISPAYTGQGTCAITSSATGQTLNCTVGDMAANATTSVHLTSATTTASCTTFPNTATGSATNQGNVTSSATTTVTCPISQVEGIISVPVTGAGPNWRDGLGLMGGGMMLLLIGAGMRRRRRRAAR
jgi:uncharacterized repeat protein (TIGR01451 family)